MFCHDVEPCLRYLTGLLVPCIIADSDIIRHKPFLERNGFNNIIIADFDIIRTTSKKK